MKVRVKRTKEVIDCNVVQIKDAKTNEFRTFYVEDLDFNVTEKTIKNKIKYILK